MQIFLKPNEAQPYFSTSSKFLGSKKGEREHLEKTGCTEALAASSVGNLSSFEPWGVRRLRLGNGPLCLQEPRSSLTTAKHVT